jgi:predicted aspartyl protease/Tfp pilus assembly protein PilF
LVLLAGNTWLGDCRALAATEDVSSLKKSAETAEHPSRSSALPPSVAAVVQAYGGATKLREHRERAMRSHGTISSTSSISAAANTYECDVLEKGEKVRVEMTMLGVPLIMGYDGKSSWTQFGDWVSLSPPSTTEMIADELRHGLPALADVVEPGSTVQVLPRQSVHNKPCDVFKVVTKEGKETTFFADPQTHLIVRAEYSGVDHELGVKTIQAIEYSDYKPVAGSVEPYHVRQFSGNKQKTETVIKSIDTEIAIDEKAFIMPPESEIARLKDGPIVLPFEYSGNEIVVKARINNGAEARFVVDTGASQSVLDKSAATALGPYPVSTFSITTGAKAVPLSYTKVSSLAIGDLTINDVPVLITDLSGIANHPAGLIGANILKRFLITIDFDEKKLILADPRNVTVPLGASVVPTAPVFGGTALVVKGRLEDKTTMNFLVDTGASFNNLPQSLAKPFYDGSVLPVGTIYGIDGQAISIGSLKLKSIKLGNLSIPGPVFTLAPDGTMGTGGLFSASALGILGNPIWSQFKTTIDYRNERLILESPPGRDKMASLVDQLNQIEQQYLRDKDVDAALKAYEKVMVSAQVDAQKGAEALAIARMAGCYADKFAASKEGRWLDMSARDFERANKVASESRDRSVEGQVLAQWALMYLNAPRSMNDITSGQSLLAKALQKAPMEPNIFAAFGTTLMRAGKKTEADKLLDRALVLDPSNWQALWAKYKLYGEQNRAQDQALVAAQLQHYYPTYPDVVALSGSKPASAQKLSAAVKKPGEPTGKPSAAAIPAAGGTTRGGVTHRRHR